MSNVYQNEPPTKGKVILHTTAGPLEIELWAKEIPKACRNFVQLCMEGYYDNTIFHRIIPNFIVQGGDPLGTGEGGESIYGKPFEDEFHTRLRFSHRGLLAMASTSLNENSSQFFFTLDKAESLNKQHTIFGKVVGDTIFNLLKIGESEVGESEFPIYPTTITSAEIVADPFEDIVPRTTPEEKKRKKLEEERLNFEIEQAKKKGKKLKKNLNLLSFEDDNNNDEIHDLENKKIKKFKSIHDISDDPSFLKEAVAFNVKNNEEFNSKKTKKLKHEMNFEDENYEIENQVLLKKEKNAKMSIIKNEILSLQKDIIEQKKGKKERKEKKQKKLSLIEEMRSQYDRNTTSTIIKNKRGKKVVLDEDDLLERLDEFKNKLKKGSKLLESKKVKNEEEETLKKLEREKKKIEDELDDSQLCKVHRWKNCKTCFDEDEILEEMEEVGEDWKDHSLNFVKEKANVYEPKLDDYTFIDPRLEAKTGVVLNSTEIRKKKEILDLVKDGKL
ncbi:Peptidyl-prolyl isomerase cwc27 [Lobulomyces angularis]|nr:Peptidyl-prolyl isomerase cwc27 [Lobulomyces angularis]